MESKLDLYKGLVRPEVVAESDSQDGSYAEISFGPLEKGFGYSIGNAIRRCLLSSIRGFSFYKVRIDGVLTQFDSVPGLDRDVLDIIMSIRKISIKCDKDKILAKINVKGPRLITSDDIVFENSDAQICGDKVELFNIEEGYSVNIDLFGKEGIGFESVSASDNNKEPGVIYIDSNFSPVRNVAFTVGHARVGDVTDYDSVEMKITTDGSIKASEAFYLSSNYIKSICSCITVYDSELFDATEKVQSKEEDEKRAKYELLRSNIEVLDLSVRSLNCLQFANIKYVHQLVIETIPSLLKVPNFGRKSASEISEKLTARGLSFGMCLDDEFKKSL